MKHGIAFLMFLFLAFSAATVAAQEKPKPKIINGGVINGKATNLPKPEYPAAALAVKASGAVNVQVTIDESGNIISASAVSGHPLLRQAAENAARLATFQPTTLSGQPVKVTGVIVYNFVAAKPDEEAAPVWAFGMFLSFLQNADSALVKEMGDEKELSLILAEMAADVPAELATEKPLFDKLAKAVDNERRIIAGELLSAIKNQSSSEEKWQIEIGEHLGAAMTELIKHKKNIAGGSAAIDASLLRTNLQKIKSSLSFAPPKISSETIKKFKSVADFSESPELNSSETLTALLDAIEPLFGSFSDE